jgi:hypothetical protein
MSLRIRGIYLVTVLALVLAGCGRRTIPVQGVITLDGVPLAGATVLFMPEGSGAGRPASGYTADDGMFELMTYQPGDGALPGTYRVLIRKSEAAKDRDTAEQNALQRAKAKYEEKAQQKSRNSSVPAVYASFDTSPLRCTVPVAGVLTVDLHTEGEP